ncbi:MAG: hydrogenase/urease maturation nickel metallochaperone HypA [bacterium]|nr:hydrogenase/urease maturation nickel metallochaperone HypA [bacterium]
MHELSIIENLRFMLKKICEEEKAKRVILIEMTIHPYSCLDEDNLNFMYSSILRDEPVLRDAKIKIKRNNALQDREYIVDSIEIEVE